MRLSVNQGDPGYWPYRRIQSKDIAIKVDGKTIDKVVTADTCSGYVKFIKTDENGKVLVDKRAECVAEDWIRGDVEILIDGQPAEVGGISKV